jgi:hypothetical protein
MFVEEKRDPPTYSQVPTPVAGLGGPVATHSKTGRMAGLFGAWVIFKVGTV